MDAIKNFTDIEQSKKLSEFLPLNTADMSYINAFVLGMNCIENLKPQLMGYNECIELSKKLFKNPSFEVIPVWSLGALINLLPPFLKDEIGMEFSLSMHKDYIEYINPNVSGLYSTYIHTCGNTNLTDSCYEMILKLHELNLL